MSASANGPQSTGSTPPPTPTKNIKPAGDGSVLNDESASFNEAPSECLATGTLLRVQDMHALEWTCNAFGDCAGHSGDFGDQSSARWTICLEDGHEGR